MEREGEKGEEEMADTLETYRSRMELSYYCGPVARGPFKNGAYYRVLPRITAYYPERITAWRPPDPQISRKIWGSRLGGQGGYYDTSILERY